MFIMNVSRLSLQYVELKDQYYFHLDFSLMLRLQKL